MTPMLQQSTEKLYPFPPKISGAIYEGLPQAVVMSSSEMTLARPKSDIFMEALGSVEV